MSLFKNNRCGDNGSGQESQSPMKQVQTPQIPTTEQRSGGDKRPITGGNNRND